MYAKDILKQTGSNSPGVHTNALLAPLSWFNVIQSPVTTPTPGSSVRITTAHTFLSQPLPSPAPSPIPSPLPTYGFVKIYTTLGTGKLGIKQVGSTDSWANEKAFEAFVPGDDPVMFELMATEEQYMLMIGQGDCANPTYFQLGTLCDPCLKDGWEWNSGEKGGTNKRGFTIKFKAIMQTPLIYSSTIATPGSY